MTEKIANRIKKRKRANWWPPKYGHPLLSCFKIQVITFQAGFKLGLKLAQWIRKLNRAELLELFFFHDYHVMRRIETPYTKGHYLFEKETE